MRSAILTLCVIALLLNVYFVSSYNFDDDPLQQFINGTGSGSGGNETDDDDDDDITTFKVNVPEPKLGDEVYYDYTTYIEMGGENTSSGEWYKIILDIDGSLESKIPDDTETKQDGFFTTHSAVRKYQRTIATLTLTYEDHETDPLVIHGNGEITRSEYQDLTEDSVFLIETHGDVEVDQTFSVDVPLQYEGDMRSYPDPNKAIAETLDDRIYGDNQTLSVGKNGTLAQQGDLGVIFNSPFTFTQDYNWTIEPGQEIAGVDTLKVNITTKFFEFLDFKREVWVSNKIAEPAKIYLITNYSFTSEDSIDYFVLEQTRTMTDYRRGSNDIPWGDCNAVSPNAPGRHFCKKSPIAKFEDWDFMPASAASDEDFEDSSFDFATEDATQFAIDNSEGLNELLDEHSWDIIVSRAKYNVTRDTQDKSDPNDKAGNYQWNMTFGYHPTEEEEREYWQEYYETGYRQQNRYNLRVDFDKERNINPLPSQPDYDETTFIAEERGFLNGSIPISKSDLKNEILTLTSSELIFKTDTDIADEIFENPSEPGEIWWDDPTHEISYEFVLSGESTQSDPIISTLTGITFPPNPRMSWSIYKESLMSSGYMYGARLDAETGQLNYIVEIEGTALMGLFT